MTKYVFGDDGELDLKESKISTDWGATNKMWEKRPDLKNKKYIFCDNFHTDGKRFRIAWRQPFPRSSGLSFYRFSPTRAFRRNLAQHLKTHTTQIYYDF